MTSILIVDNNKDYSDSLCRKIQDNGFNATCAYTLKDGFKKGKRSSFDVVLLNNSITNGRNADVLQQFLNMAESPEVIVLADKMTPEEAEIAIESGAWDYISKPSAPEKICQPLITIAEYRSKTKDNKKKKIKRIRRESGIVGNSMELSQCFEVLHKAANSDANVLITGETGTGKELFASAVHKNSRRAKKNFVVIDCAALPETLVESTLFGHEKGSFTGAVKNQTGLIKQADGGTLFLDEVGELPLPIQKSFLRVLEEGRFRPVGSDREETSNFRLVAATNQNLEQMVGKGTFREDLLFRLRTFNLHLPPLRDRTGDIKDLCNFYFDRMKEIDDFANKEISPEYVNAVRKYEWPGNVRELFHALERSCAAANDDQLLIPKHLPTYIRTSVVRRQATLDSENYPEETATAAVYAPPVEENRSSVEDENESIIEESCDFAMNSDVKTPLKTLQDIRDEILTRTEEKYLHELTRISGGNVKKACNISGLSRSRLYALLKTYDLRMR